MKQFMFVMFIVIGVAGIFPVYADTTYVSGHITSDANWTKANSPYIVEGDVYVDSLVTLTIEPGVKVKLDSMKCIEIKGTLNAIGTESDSIIITRNGTARWERLWFKPASTDSLSYCRIEYAGKSAIYIDATSFLVIEHNTIANNFADYDPDSTGGGICSWGSPVISGNIITENHANFGGGIWSYGSPTISNNTITNNYAGWAGGGIYSKGSPTISGNIITGNSASWVSGGGIWSHGSPTITGNTITNNPAYGSGIFSIFGLPTIKYNTITDTTTSAIAIYIYSDSALIDSNNIYATGYTVYNNGGSNIDARYNYWGTTSSDTIDMKICDFYDYSTRGIVYYEPFLTEPLDFGIEEKTGNRQKAIGIRVYPNPFTQRTAIKLLSYSNGFCEQAIKEASLKIYDLSGRFVKSYTMGRNPEIAPTTITIGKTLKAGIYFLKTNGYKPIKIVKLR